MLHDVAVCIMIGCFTASSDMCLTCSCVTGLYNAALLNQIIK